MSTDTRDSESAVVLLPHIREVVIKLAEEYGYDDPRFVAGEGSKAGDGYASLMIRVQIKSNSQPDKKPLSLIFKCTPQNEKRREAFNMDKVFRNEHAMYCEILPAFAEYLYEKGAIKEKHFPSTPRCYTSITAGDETDCLVLEDLRARKFTMANRFPGLSASHLRLTVAALARLHATSRAYEIEKPQEFKKLESHINKLPLADEMKMLEGFFDGARKAIELTTARFPEGTIEYQKSRAFMANFKDEMQTLITADPDGLNVITHSDCWANNLMFVENPETGKAEEVVLIDLQGPRYGSPVADLSYFLFLNSTREVRGDLSELLSFYVDEFNKLMRAVNCEKGIISLSMLNQKMKKYGRIGLAFATMYLKVMLSESKDVPDLNERFEKGENIGESFDFHCENIELVQERITDILEDTVKLGYL